MHVNMHCRAVDAPDTVWVTPLVTLLRNALPGSGHYLYQNPRRMVVSVCRHRPVLKTRCRMVPSRQIALQSPAGQWMQSRMTTDLALQALLSAVWRRKPKTKVMIYSDQGSRFTSTEWQSFLGKHNLDASMSRRGNCHDNAVAESFFQLLKRERIRRRTYLTRDAARQDVFDYIEMFYNPTRKHTNNGMLSPVDYEMKQKKMNEAGV